MTRTQCVYNLNDLAASKPECLVKCVLGPPDLQPRNAMHLTLGIFFKLGWYSLFLGWGVKGPSFCGHWNFVYFKIV
jgi:hypothetical protein